MKKLSFLILSITLFTAALLTNCASDSSAPPTPLFADTELISASYSSGTITYTMPNVKYSFIVISAFSPAPVIIDNVIQNSSAIRAGIRTGMAGFSTSSVLISDMKAYSNGDYTGAPYTYNAGDKLYIWAYDSGYNLVASSSSAGF